MDTSTEILTVIDPRCSDCLLRTYQRLFGKFNTTVTEQQDFLMFFKELIRVGDHKTTPEIQRELSLAFSSISGVVDLFAEEKAESNRVALELYSEWKPKVTASANPFKLALRLSIAGNIMDYGASNSFDIHHTIEYVNSAGFAIDHTDLLEEAISRAKKILYLGDNAGEIVLDKLFLETIGHPDVTFAVRGGIALNDATIQDAEAIGMEAVAIVISNGFDAPSTVLAECSAEFLTIYHAADLIISKGQGNLEGLIDENDPRIFFLLMVKCELMAEKLSVEKGSFVVYNQTIAPWV
ncbi:MAG: DUF89 family protein [Lentimicrobium sp.]|nr:DUF89 family protein [Lentimicrobium sp.]